MNRIERLKNQHPILFALIRTVDVVLNGLVHGATGYTLSAWYGKHRPHCLLCRLFHRYMEPWHCTVAALTEGLITPEEAEAHMKERTP
jgi:hypothetical protein